jgi:hypothetical protein
MAADFTEVISFINNSSTEANSAFTGLKTIMIDYGKSLALLGITMYILYNYILKQFGATKMVDLNIDKLAVMCIIIVYFHAYDTTMGGLKKVFEYPRKEMLGQLNSSAQSMYGKIETMQKKKIEEEKSAEKRYRDGDIFKKLSDGGEAIARLPKLLMLGLYSILLMLCIAILLAIILIQILMSIWGAELMIALGPIAFGMQFIPAYSGALANYLKNLFSVYLIGAVVAAFGVAIFKLNIMDYIFQILVEVSMQQYSENPSLSFDIMPLITLIILMYLAAAIPSFVDKVVNSSAGGAFSGAMSGGAMLGSAMMMAKAGTGSAVGSTLSAGASVGGSLLDAGKKMGGGLKDIASALDDVSSNKVSSTISSAKDAISNNNPLSTKNVEGFGEKMGKGIAEKLNDLTNTKGDDLNTGSIESDKKSSTIKGSDIDNLLKDFNNDKK